MILIGPYPEKSSRIQLKFFKKGSGEKKLSVYAQNSYDCVLFFTGRCSYTCKVISVEGKMNIQMREVCVSVLKNLN